jgi:hypothetical protein
MPRIPIEQLQQLPEFTLLPAGHQKFFTVYIANGYDAQAAVRECYPKARTAESVRVMASRIVNSPGVIMLLHLHYGDDPQQAFCQMLAKQILRGRISKEQTETMRLLAQVHGFVKPWEPRYEKKFKDGMSNTRDAVKRREQREAQKEAVPKKNLLEEFENF